MAKKNKLYEQSTDYQLPPGELWWLIVPKSTTAFTILFHHEKAQTWFQAKQRAEIMIREDYPEYIAQHKKLPEFRVILWEPVLLAYNLRFERFKQFS